MKPTAVSLFAGVGGFDLALRNNGYDLVASVEINSNCNKVLEEHFPNTKRYTDIKEVRGEDLINDGFNPTNGIITGGFPCQDLSVAGKRVGLAGSRSGLFWEVVRLLEETKSENFILENVPGLLSSNGGKDFGVVLGALVELGYSVGWRVLDAQYFGVAQRRRRVFIVGSRSGAERVTEILFKSKGLQWNTKKSEEQKQDSTDSTTKIFGQSSFAGYTEGPATLTATSYKRPEDNLIVFKPHQTEGARIQGDVINTLTASMGTGGNNVPMIAKKQVRRLTPKECERLQGFPDDWTISQSDTQRYKQMGNAVAVPVVDWLIKGFSS